MADDKWLIDLGERVRRSRDPRELRDLIERLEDHYDAFSGPGQEQVEQLLGAARARLARLTG